VTHPAPAVDEPLEDEEIVEDDEVGGSDRDGQPDEGRRTWRGPSAGRWILFAGLAVLVVVFDQLSKAWVADRLAPGSGMVVIDGLLNVVHGQNSGMLFGLLPQSAPAFALVSVVVTGFIVVYHWKAGRGIVTTVALSLLLGGAIGNLLDRLNHGYVIDWVDMGIGSVRFWTYNIADACITTAILLLIAMALVPRIAEWGADG
jgi:signal peptidase II